MLFDDVKRGEVVLLELPEEMADKNNIPGGRTECRVLEVWKSSLSIVWENRRDGAVELVFSRETGKSAWDEKFGKITPLSKI